MVPKQAVTDEVLQFSHDLSNLLVGVQGYARLLECEHLVMDQGKEYLEKLLEISERAAERSKAFREIATGLKKRDESEAREREQRKRLERTHGKQILVIDDEPAVRDLATTLLVGAGFEVMTAVDGPEGIALFEAHKFDCVLLDLTMPVMGGNLVFAKLRAINPGIPVVLISAYITEQRIREFSKVGNFHFVEKPFHATDLVRTVTAACSPRMAETKLVENF